MVNIEIRTIEEYEAATRLVEKLNGAEEGSPDEQKLKMLMAAIEVWDARHDDATRWK